MLKWIVSLVVIMCSIYIGAYLKKLYKRRSEFYSDYEGFIGFCYEKISTMLTPIDKLKNDFLCNKDFKLYLRGERVEILSKREKDELNFVVSGLGHSDCENTLEVLSREREKAHALKGKADEEIKKKGDLCFKLSIIIGLAIALVI